MTTATAIAEPRIVCRPDFGAPDVLHMETFGEGPDVFLVHGWAMHGGLWGTLVKSLTPHFRLHVVDLPGHGLSAGTVPPADIDLWARKLLAIAPRQAVWIGWSLGGLIAQAAYRLEPERIVALGLIATTPSFVARDGWDPAVARQMLRKFGDSVRADPRGTLTRFLTLQVRGCDKAPATLRALRSALASRELARTEALGVGLDLLLHTDLRPSWPFIEVPVLALFGERDTLVPSAAAAHPLLERAPKARVEIVKGAGHAPFWSHPRSVCGRVRAFLADAF